MTIGNNNNRSESGPYLTGTFHGPDRRFVEDLEHIDGCVRTADLEKTNPELIGDYVKWRKSLKWYHKCVVPNDTMAVAKKKFDAIRTNTPPAKFEGALGDFVFGPNRPALIAVNEYIENSRPSITQHPGLLPIIQEFEKWYTGLGTYDKNFVPDEVLQNAYYFRDKVNVEKGTVLDPTWVPGDVGSPTHLPAEKPANPVIPTWLKWAMGIGAGVAGVVVVALGAKSLTPLAFAERAVKKRKLKKEMSLLSEEGIDQ